MLSCDEVSAGVTPSVCAFVVSYVAAGKRLAIPGGTLPPLASFLVIPGGSSRSRFAKPGGTAVDLPDDDGSDVVGGAVLEICIWRLR